MTRDEILAMPAGPEMDRAVAECVGLPSGRQLRAGRPSVAIAQSFLALERWRAKDPSNHYRIEAPSGPVFPVHTVVLKFCGCIPARRWEANADPLSLAICRALLLAAEAGGAETGHG